MAVGSLAETLNFGYCTDEIIGVGHGQADVFMAGAICIPAEQARQFAGNKITYVSVGFGASTPKKVTVFLTYDLKEQPFYTQEARLKVNQFNDVPLTTPYEFEDKDVYVGYSIRTTAASDFPIGFDGYTAGANPNGDWYTSSMDESKLLSSWRHEGSEHGNLSLRILVDGDQMAGFQRIANLMNLQVPTFVRPEIAFAPTLVVQNNGAADITSLGVTTKISDEAEIVKTLTLSPALVSGECRIIELPGITTNATGQDIPMTVTLTKVNGDTNQATDGVAITTTLVSSKYLMNRTCVIEEGTGQWCGWCPRGYVALENMREKYTDGSYIGIAVHRMSGGDPKTDVMHCSSYDSFAYANFSSYPTAVYNRITKYAISPESTQDVYNYVTALPANAFIKISAEYADDTHKDVKVYVIGESPKDMNSHKYGVAIVLTEDNVGPYNQNNYYAGGSSGKMGGFESMSSYPKVMFNDVARDIFDWQGNRTAFPAQIKANTPYLYEKTVSLANVTNPENANVIALLINTANGEIENAASCRIGNMGNMVAVSEIGDDLHDGLHVALAPGALTVSGEGLAETNVYDIAGKLHATLHGEGTAYLAPGLYIVNAMVGGHNESVKVIIK